MSKDKIVRTQAESWEEITASTDTPVNLAERLEALKAENARLRAKIRNAPHEHWCAIETRPAVCNCWKSEAAQ